MGVDLYGKGDYIGMYTGDYLLLSDGVINHNQVYYDAEETIKFNKAILDIKKQIR